MLEVKVNGAIVGRIAPFLLILEMKPPQFQVGHPFFFFFFFIFFWMKYLVVLDKAKKRDINEFIGLQVKICFSHVLYCVKSKLMTTGLFF